MKPAPWRRVTERGDLAIVLLRHGRTDWNASRRFLGTTDIPLDEEGVGQAEAVAPFYRSEFHHIYCSPLSRARETAAALNHPLTVVPDFGELHQGDLEGLTASEAVSLFPAFFEHWARDPETAQVPNGETLGACAARARRGIDRLCRHHPLGEAVLVVTHQMVIATLACAASGVSIDHWRKYCVENTAGTVLGWNGLTLNLEISGWRPAT